MGYYGLSNMWRICYGTLNIVLKNSLPSTGYRMQLFNV